MGTAEMRVVPEFLVQLLLLPEGTEILDAWIDLTGAATLIFTVHHPDIDKDEVTPQYRSHYDKEGNITKAEFITW